ncbi:MAG: efflux RND transporter permease subunit [Gammaproteobacteria bacterium]|nr:efflux RND transporter permease subunit [Gammaproteobacteria bacterium]
MHAIIDAAFDRSRTAILIFVFLVASGVSAYIDIPKESDPDVAIPIIYVSMSHDGISPEDAERLLIRPMETELQGIVGVKEMTASASEGHGSVTLEFDAGFDSKQALEDVREKVDLAKTKLPSDTDEPSVNEVNVALFPVLTVSLSGPVPERTLLQVARRLRDRIEAIPDVLSVDIAGEREELMEVVVDPIVMETYNIRYDEVLSLVGRNNLLVAAGALDTGSGRLVLKVPGVIETAADLLKIPIKVSDDTVVTFADVATVHRTFKDPEGFARVDGQPALAREVSKRIWANISETIEEVRAVVAREQAAWPSSLEVRFLQDKSKDTRIILADLQNNVLSAILLVMIVIIAALGVRSSILVGLAIPGSFLSGIFVLYSSGLTMNIVVLFSLILVVGMLVDGAIVVTELADRRMQEGLRGREAFRFAAKRMSWPIAASTATTLAVFFPLLFWPGVIGEFMKYLPLTVIACLTASLAMALVFVPVIGGALAKRKGAEALDAAPADVDAAGRYVEGDVAEGTGWFASRYSAFLARVLRRPSLTLLVAVLVLVGTSVGYKEFGKGVEFFPEVEQDFAQVVVRARGDLSVHEKDRIVREVESRILGMDEVRIVYSRTYNAGSSANRAEDVVGVVQLEFVDWQSRRKADEILDDMRRKTENLPGIVLEFRKQEDGPGGGKPVSLQLVATGEVSLDGTAEMVLAQMEEIGGFVDIEDSRPPPGIEWRLEVNREEAARYGADVQLLGSAVQMVSHGIKVGDYRPTDGDDEVDIRVRFPFGERNLDQLDQLRVPTARGMIPIGNFVSLVPAPKTGTIKRSDSRRSVSVDADVAQGVLADDQVKLLREAIAEQVIEPGVEVQFKGQDEEQREAAAFLSWAFATAVFLMALILVTQFNSIYQAVIVLSAIGFSTAGVLLGLLVTGQTFGIVMVGIGIIALAGIVVNNNIVLIDTYNTIRREGLSPIDAAVSTGRLRLRPVLLTAITTVLGLLPMVFALNINLVERSFAFGAPSTQWWTQLSSAIAGGLSFATVLTLVLTPCLLVLGDTFAVRTGALMNKLKRLVRPSSARATSA